LDIKEKADNNCGENIKIKGNISTKGLTFTKDSLTLTPTQVNLLEMANHSDISATAFTICMGNQSKCNCYFVHEPPILRQDSEGT
jgi:hypothetical protein